MGKQQLLLILQAFGRVATILPYPDPVKILDGLLHCTCIWNFFLCFNSIHFPSACNIVALIGAGDVLFMPFWFHSISAISISIQSKEIQLCQDFSGSVCPVLHLFHICGRDFFFLWSIPFYFVVINRMKSGTNRKLINLLNIFILRIALYNIWKKKRNI